jgi:predicted TIM-barrel fold metal-dependent hydrolase
MNVTVRERDVAQENETRFSYVDCDVHPAAKNPNDVAAFMPARWREHFYAYGSFPREPLSDTIPYPRMAPAISRNDSWPPSGGPPGSDLDFMRAQHLDAHGVEYGILIPLATRGPEQRNLDYCAAYCAALNDWQIEYFVRKDKRLRASILVPYEDGPAAAAEIERCAGDADFAQIQIPPRTMEPLGRKKYWPMFEAAARTGRPIGIHVGGAAGHAQGAGTGWPSYYIEEHHTYVQAMQAAVTSMVIEGVFERFPDLKLALIESGFGWLPPLAWRLDKQWKRLKAEVPHLKRAPSEYIRDHIWGTTRPIEEPPRAGDLLATMEWIGFDRIMFSTDYPHWDFDDPRYALNVGLSEAQKARIFRENAKAFYRLG